MRLRAGTSGFSYKEWKGPFAIDAQPWEEAFVFFKHEDEGAAPRLAKRLLSI